MKETITGISTFFFYIAFSVFFGLRSGKMRAHANEKFKKKAEANNCVTEASNIKMSTEHEIDTQINGETNTGIEYELVTFEYIVNGKRYRFKRKFNLYGKTPYAVTVWYKKNNPKKRIVSCDDYVNKIIWIVYFIPLVFGVILYKLLGFFGL